MIRIQNLSSYMRLRNCQATPTLGVIVNRDTDTNVWNTDTYWVMFLRSPDEAGLFSASSIQCLQETFHDVLRMLRRFLSNWGSGLPLVIAPLWTECLSLLENLLLILPDPVGACQSLSIHSIPIHKSIFSISYALPVLWGYLPRV